MEQTARVVPAALGRVLEGKTKAGRGARSHMCMQTKPLLQKEL